MTEPTREERLRGDLRSLKALQSASTIFECHTDDENPEAPTQYTLLFHGRGLRRGPSPGDPVEFVNLHRCELRLPTSYPENPPDIRWLTPVFHPNISFSGLVDPPAIGLEWNSQYELDLVCERLWDLARWAHMEKESASNSAAVTWLEGQSELPLPIDHRPLRDRSTPASCNIVHYQRRGSVDNGAPAGRDNSDVLYIDDNSAKRGAGVSESGVLFIDD